MQFNESREINKYHSSFISNIKFDLNNKSNFIQNFLTSPQLNSFKTPSI